MRGNANGPGERKLASPAVEPVCGKLRTLFDVAAEPMPESLASLADRLDEAFARGELSGEKKPRDR